MSPIIISKHDRILKRNIEKTAREIRNKVLAMRKNEQDAREIFNKSYEPIIEPVREILSEFKDEKQQRSRLQPLKQELQLSKSESPPQLALTTKQGIEDFKRERKFLEDNTVNTPVNYQKLMPKKLHDAHNDEDDEVFSTHPIDANTSPTLEELRSEVEAVENVNENAYQQYLESYHPLTAEYVDKHYRNTDDEPLDEENGVKLDLDTEKWFFGDKEIKFLDNGDVQVDTDIYNGTRGLYELMFMRNPKSLSIKNADRIAYKTLCEATNAYKHNVTAAGSSGRRLSGSTKQFALPPKYDAYIREQPATQQRRRLQSDSHGMRLRDRSTTDKKKKGGKIYAPQRDFAINFDNMLKTHNGYAKDYVFYDDYNELVARLRKLISAKLAGNTSVENEIVSIIEELREAYIIE